MNLPEQIPWLNATVAGNELWRMGAFFGLVLLGFAAGKGGRGFFERQRKRWEQAGRPLPATLCGSLADSVAPLCLALALNLALDLLRMLERLQGLADAIGDVLVVAAVTWLLYCLAELAECALHKVAGQTATTMDQLLAPLLRKSLRVTIVIMGVLQAATMLSDKPLTSVIAGLGVGTLAVGLAAQDTIKNFFGSLLLLADRPFELGDRIIVDATDGVVEELGFRSTRVRTLEGHLVTIPNGDLAAKAVKNIAKRPHIKHAMSIGLTYDTPPEKMREALGILEELLREHEGLHPDYPPRVFFNEFRDSALSIAVTYWYHPADYWKYMAFNQALNLRILERFNAAGLSFAFPSQTVYLAGAASPSEPAGCS